jgi:hypothetical protein
VQAQADVAAQQAPPNSGSGGSTGPATNPDWDALIDGISGPNNGFLPCASIDGTLIITLTLNEGCTKKLEDLLNLAAGKFSLTDLFNNAWTAVKTLVSQGLAGLGTLSSVLIAIAIAILEWDASNALNDIKSIDDGNGVSINISVPFITGIVGLSTLLGDPEGSVGLLELAISGDLATGGGGSGWGDWASASYLALWFDAN